MSSNVSIREGAMFLGFIGSLAAGLTVWALQSRMTYAEFPVDDFFQPETVADIAAALDHTSEDAYILSAWEWVGSNMAYTKQGSDLEFVDSHVKCNRCVLPPVSVERMKGNCLAKSSVLVSLLRHRLPSSHVALVVGDVLYNGVGGHAWVEVTRHGEWYLLESTGPPGQRPWKTAESLSELYVPLAFVNDERGIECNDAGLQLSLSDCIPCNLKLLQKQGVL